MRDSSEVGGRPEMNDLQAPGTLGLGEVRAPVTGGQGAGRERPQLWPAELLDMNITREAAPLWLWDRVAPPCASGCRGQGGWALTPHPQST